MTPPAPAGFEGRWQPLRAELDGELAPADALARMEVELHRGHYTVRFAGEISDRGTYRHSADGAPLELTLAGTHGPNAGRTIPCIFQLVGARLRVCYGLDGVRPDAFTAPAGSARYLVTYRRLA